MSNSSSQRLRKNASPSSTTRQGPLRATQQFSLLSGTGSPSRKTQIRRTPTSSPTSKGHKLAKARSHSETGFVSERRSPTSLNYKVEKPKALRAGGSLESITLYLSGQWPKDGSKPKTDNCGSSSYVVQNYCYDGIFKKDEHTQTPDDWDDIDSRKLSHRHGYYKRSHSVGSGDNWNLKSKDIKARLQRKDGTTARSSQTSQRFSPIPVTSSSTYSPHSSQPIKIPVPTYENGVLRGTPGKARASVEGLNQEVEKLIISGHYNKNSYEEGVTTQSLFDYPDGHRAPVPELPTRNVDTQTPSQSDYSLFYGGEIILEAAAVDGRTSSQASSDAEDSRPQSVSPSFIPGAFDMDDSISTTTCGDCVRSNSVQTASSPNPKNQFVRMPPDGAEKIKVIDEIDTLPRMKTFLTPAASIRLQPSERSAFQSLLKKPMIDIGACSPIPILDDCCVEQYH